MLTPSTWTPAMQYGGGFDGGGGDQFGGDQFGGGQFGGGGFDGGGVGFAAGGVSAYLACPHQAHCSHCWLTGNAPCVAVARLRRRVWW